MRFSETCYCLFLLLSLFFFSCHRQQTEADEPAYHNPLVQPLTEAIAAEPENPELLFQRSQTLIQIDALELAENDLQQAFSMDNENLKYIFALAQINLSLDHTQDAINHLEILLTKAPGSGPAKLLLAQAFLQNQQPEKAIDEVDFILKADSAYPGALYTLANIKLVQKDTNAANAALKKALQFRKDDYQASLLLADNMAWQHNKDAVGQYRTTFELDTTDVTPLISIGEFFEQEKQMSKAKALYREALLKDPDCTNALINMGQLLFQEDSISKALRHFKLATKTQPNSADAYYHIGLCFEKLDMKDSARIAFGQAAIFAPDDQEIKEGWERNITENHSGI